MTESFGLKLVQELELCGVETDLCLVIELICNKWNKQ